MNKLIYNEVITKDNIQDNGERMAICAVKGLAQIMDRYEIYKLYALLLNDITHKNKLGYIISDGYDIVQETICFLYDIIGERLSDRTCRG